MNEFSKLPSIKSLSLGEIKEGRKTILIIGQGRGGTSLTSAVIDALGIPMDGSIDGHFERSEFKDFNGINERILYLNNEHKSWGTQVLITDLEQISKMVINPICIFIFRDLAAMMQRRISVDDYDYLKPVIYSTSSLIRRGYEEFKIFYEVFAATHLPKLMLSFERLKYESHIIDDLIEYLNLPKKNKQKALDRIGTGYLLQ